MPRQRPSLYLSLRLSVLILLLVSACIAVLALRWGLRDARTAVQDDLVQASRVVAGEMERAMRRSTLAAAGLAQSPSLRLWMKYDGARPTPTNRAHAESAMLEVANYREVTGVEQVAFASEKTRTLQSPGASPRGLSAGSPEDEWYFQVSEETETVVRADPRGIRASAGVREGGRLLGAVSVFSGPSLYEQAAGAAGLGMTAAICDAAGSIIVSSGAAAQGAESLFDVYPPSARAMIQSALDGLAASGDTAALVAASREKTVAILAAPTPASGTFLFLSQPVAGSPRTERILMLAAAAAAGIVLLALVFFTVAQPHVRGFDAAEERWQADRETARAGFEALAHMVRNAESTAARVAGGADALGKEASGAVQSLSDLRAIVSKLTARISEMRASMDAGADGTARAAREAKGAAAQGEDTRRAAGELTGAVSASEEALGRIVASTAAASRAITKLKAETSAISEAASRARLLALNASIDATRAGERGKRIGASAEEIRALAEKCVERAEALSAMIAAAGESASQAHHESEAAGRSIHGAAARAGALASLAQAAAKALQSRAEADVTTEPGASQARAEEAALGDRVGSALAGLQSIAERIARMARDERDLAEKSAADLKRTTQAAMETASTQKGIV